MEAAALFERVLYVSLPRLEFQIFLKAEAGYGLQAIALSKRHCRLAKSLTMEYLYGASGNPIQKGLFRTANDVSPIANGHGFK